MNTTQHSGIVQCWFVTQHKLMPELRSKVGALTPKLEQVMYDCGMLVDAFLAKAVLGLSATIGLIERLAVD